MTGHDTLRPTGLPPALPPPQSPFRSVALAVALALALLVSLPTAAAADPLAPFPPARAGEIRYVIDLPPRADEALHQVELIAGRTLAVDCNRHHLSGDWEEISIAGWGYTYQRLRQVGPLLSTRMACPPGSTQPTFVKIGGEARLVRYNSRLPLVIHAPAEVEIRYRIWSTAAESRPASAR